MMPIKTIDLGSQDNTFKCMMDMVHAVMVLTNDVSTNPEY